MSLLTPSNVLIGLGFIVGLIILVYLAARFFGVITTDDVALIDDYPYEDLPDQTEEDDDDDYDDEDDYDDDEEDEEDEADEIYGQEIVNPKVAVEVNSSLALVCEMDDTITRMTKIDWVTEQDFARMKHRAENPRLYADDWFEKSRKEFSLWSVGMYQELAAIREECGVAA